VVRRLILPVALTILGLAALVTGISFPSSRINCEGPVPGLVCPVNHHVGIRIALGVTGLVLLFGARIVPLLTKKSKGLRTSP
jgi:hypothetical protein